MNTHPSEPATCAIIRYDLDHLQKGEQHFYVWRHHPRTNGLGRTALLIGLNNIYLPDHEIDKLVLGFDEPMVGVIAFTGCHAHNQQEIKRRLKSHNIKLYSKTAFFGDPTQAAEWLKAHGASC